MGEQASFHQSIAVFLNLPATGSGSVFWSHRKHKPALPLRAHGEGLRRRGLSVSRLDLTGRPSWVGLCLS